MRFHFDEAPQINSSSNAKFVTDVIVIDDGDNSDAASVVDTVKNPVVYVWLCP